MSLVYLGLGSNLGDRLSYIQQAVQLLKDNNDIKILYTSSFYETEPVGIKSEQWFINAVIAVETSIDAETLLKMCLEIESTLGRARDSINTKLNYESRTIDIDILFYDDLIISTDIVQVPHPRVHQRAYTLVPLLELNPDLIHPIFDMTLLDIHSTLLDPEEVYLYGTRRQRHE